MSQNASPQHRYCAVYRATDLPPGVYSSADPRFVTRSAPEGTKYKVFNQREDAEIYLAAKIVRPRSVPQGPIKVRIQSTSDNPGEEGQRGATWAVSITQGHHLLYGTDSGAPARKRRRDRAAAPEPAVITTAELVRKTLSRSSYSAEMCAVTTALQWLLEGPQHKLVDKPFTVVLYCKNEQTCQLTAGQVSPTENAELIYRAQALLRRLLLSTPPGVVLFKPAPVCIAACTLSGGDLNNAAKRCCDKTAADPPENPDEKKK